MRRCPRLLWNLLFAWSAVTHAASVSAQTSPPSDELPNSALRPDATTSGDIEVVKGTFATATDRLNAVTNALEGSLQAGGLFSAGNARAISVTSAGDFRLRASSHQFSVQGAANYGQSGKAGLPTVSTVSNIQGLLRYDLFFLAHWSSFLQATARRDAFQGLDLRFNADPGVAYFIVDLKTNRLWGELGYDFQYDIRRSENLDQAAASGMPAAATVSRHSVRAFAGYENKLNPGVKVHTGLEIIQSLESGPTRRVNWLADLRSAVSTRFSAATTVTLRFDNNPLPGVQKLDVLTAVSLVYTVP